MSSLISWEMRVRSAGTPSHSPIKAALFLGRAVLALLLALVRPREAVRPVVL